MFVKGGLYYILVVLMDEIVGKVWSNLVDRFKGWDYHSELFILEENQKQPKELIDAAGIERLKSLLSHCKLTVPYYQDSMKSLGFDPLDISGLADIQHLPIITKNDLRLDYGRYKSKASVGRTEFWGSSGSTGQPFYFERERRSIKINTFAALMRGKRWWGFHEGMPEGMIWSGLSDTTNTFGGRAQALKRKVSWSLKNITPVDVYLLNDEAVLEAFMVLGKSAPKYVRCIASGLLRFCSGIVALGLDGRSLGIKVAFFTGEGLSRAQRDFIEDVLACKTVCEYGCTELGIIAFECPSGNLHISSDNMIVEFLADGKPAEPGQQAELVITNLNEFARPLIRYKIGDLAAPCNDVCDCGINLPLINELGGRVHDKIVMPNGREIHGLFFSHLFDRIPQVSQFKVIQKRIDFLTIQVIIADGDEDGIVDKINQNVAELLSHEMAVEVEKVKFFPAETSGKMRWIVSNI